MPRYAPKMEQTSRIFVARVIRRCPLFLVSKESFSLVREKKKEKTESLRSVYIRECGSTLYVGMAQGVSLSLYIGIGAKFENTQKTGERRLCTAEYRTVLL